MSPPIRPPLLASGTPWTDSRFQLSLSSNHRINPTTDHLLGEQTLAEQVRVCGPIGHEDGSRSGACLVQARRTQNSSATQPR
jgi:hypothetical protein